MDAFDSGDEIRNGIQSVLEQKGLNFELLITGGEDTAAIVQSFGDQRIRFLSCKFITPARAYNSALQQSNAEFFATMHARVILLPGALEKMLHEFEGETDCGSVHSYYFRLDEKGNINRDQFRRQRERLIEWTGVDSDYWKEFVVYGSRVAGYFRIYRSEVVRMLGNFREDTKLDPDHEMYFKIMAARFRIRVVPEHLYSWRVDPRWFDRALSLLSWARRAAYLLRQPNQPRGLIVILATLFAGFSVAAGLQALADKHKKSQNTLSSRFRRIWNSLLQLLYRKILVRLPEWPIPDTQNNLSPDAKKRIAYYIWHFPVLSQTFVNRELSALTNSGLSVLILADEAEDTILADENAKALLTRTRYLLPLKIRELGKYKMRFFFRNPVRYFNLFFFVITHRFSPFKNLSRDQEVFSKAVYLAGILKEEKINHIHSPWTDRCAFLSLLASKLLGISYSVQSRAHEVHRKTYLFGLRENLENASFVVTNSEYNRSYLQSIVREKSQNQIIKIYNGIDLNRFVTVRAKETEPEIFKVLSVSRLIEQKGLLYLLKACKILKDRRIPFRCEIVGGPEDELFINYVLDLRKAHRNLELLDTVQFSGILPFEKVLQKYESADLFVLPSVIGTDGSRDITPNALIEAMAMQLPVISTTVTAIPEIIDHEVNGLLVPPNDEMALADAMIKLMESPALRKELGENARRKVENSFDIAKNVRRYLELFSSNGDSDISKLKSDS